MPRKPYPYSAQLEAGLLGLCIAHPVAIDRTLSMPLEAMGAPHHRELLRLLRAMRRGGHAVDILTVEERIRSTPDRYGGIVYVLELLDKAPASAHAADSYARDLSELHQRRILRELSDHLDSHADAAPLPELFSASTDYLSRAQRTAGSSSRPLGSVAAEMTEEICDAVEGKSTPYLPTGWEEINRLLNGGLRTGVTVLAARPGMGKTATALQLALDVATADKPVPVGVCSLEMGATQLAQRLMAQLRLSDADGRTVDYTRILRAEQGDDGLAMAAGDFEALAPAIPIHVDDRSGLTVEEIEAQARVWADQGVGLIVVDYLQICKPSRPGMTQGESAAHVSGVLRDLAQDLQIPIVLLSQLSRGVEQRADKRPKSSDLRWAGEIEQDAVAIIMVYRDQVYNEKASPNAIELPITKNRFGSQGTPVLHWDGPQQTVTDHDPKEIFLMD